MIKKLNEIHLDALKEVGNIGVANAATSLSILLNRTIDITIPSVDIVDIEDICEFVGGEEEIVNAVFFRVIGDFEGNFFLIIKEHSLKKLVHNLYTENHLNMSNNVEMDYSLFNEFGNILAASYVSSLSDLICSRLSLTVPQSAKDMAGAILTYGIHSYGEIGNDAMIINTSFYYDNEKIEGYMLFLPEPNTLHSFFNKFGIGF
ncbi:CheY-P-specific phosphatase CheC [Bacillus cereus]|uniref:CheY-P-specific phosphatase CheC n=1 Tax=Bacillus cereus TaxID=1396 RepID=A0A9X6SRT9_BACCE|nr:chemotaxis protein CheC [Bacillus cereus]PDZ93841.1 CheY-P-specific phosphatase CheC [Bacillus cereus]